jgi:hypothetical protein
VRVGDWKLLKRQLLGTATRPAAPTSELYNLAAASDPAAAKTVQEPAECAG